MVVFYGGEQVCGDPGDLIEVAALGGFVERGFTVVVFYGGEECCGDPGDLIEVAFPGSVV